MTEQQQIYPTWQSVFINLINESANKYIAKDWFGSWDCLLVLQSWLPQVCYDETKGVYDAVKRANHAASFNGYYAYQLTAGVRTSRERFWRVKLLEVSAVARQSLEKHGYLSRETGAQPKIPETAKIGERTP